MGIHVPTTDCGGCCDDGGGGGGVAAGYALSNFGAAQYAVTNPVNVGASGGSAVGLASPLQVSLTNPSATNGMIVRAYGMIPNLNISARDAADQLIDGLFHFTRIAQLTHIESGGDMTEAAAQEGNTKGAPIFQPFITPALTLMLHYSNLVPPGGTATFELSEFPITFKFDDVAIDHLRVGTQEQSNQARARLFVDGTLV